MHLYNTNGNIFYGNYGYGNRHGPYTAHNEGTQTQFDAHFYNFTYLECTHAGFRQGSAGSPTENTVLNGLVTGNPGTWGIENARVGTEELIEDYTLIDSFATADYFNQTPGANDVLAAPTFLPDVTNDDDFVGVAGTTLDMDAGGIFTLLGVQGERVCRLDGAGAFTVVNDGGGPVGLQSIYLAPERNDPNQWIRVTIDASWTTEVNGAYPFVRLVDDDNMVFLRIQGTGASGLQAKKMIGGVETTLITAQPVAGDVVDLLMYTETVELLVNGVSQGVARVLATELDPLNTRAGIFSNSPSAAPQWSNFESGILMPEMRPMAGGAQVGQGIAITGVSFDPDGKAYGNPPNMGAFA